MQDRTDCDRSLREISAYLRRSGTAASASQRSAPVTIAARACVPPAIVALCGAPGDKAWDAAPVAKRSAPLGWHGNVGGRRCAQSPGTPSMAPIQDQGRSAGSTGPPQCHARSLRVPQAECCQSSSARRRRDTSIEHHNSQNASLVRPIQCPGARCSARSALPALPQFGLLSCREPYPRCRHAHLLIRQV